MNLKPLGDRVVVRPEAHQGVTQAGIVIPDTAQKETQRGEVIAVGPGPRSPWTGEVAKMDISEGDHVIFSRHAGTELDVQVDEVEGGPRFAHVLVLREPDIVAVVDG